MFTKLVFDTGRLLRSAGVNFSEGADKPISRMLEVLKGTGSIQFAIEYYPDGKWTAESTNIDGIITGGDNVKEINATIRDAIFTFFEIPPHLADDSLIAMDNEPAMVAGRAFAAR